MIDNKNIFYKKKILKYFHLLSITKFLVKKIKTLFRSRVKITNDENYLFDINNFSDEFLSQKAIETFEHSCIRTFETDHEIIQNCKYDQFLKMEEFVSSKEYFKECFIKITGKNLSNEILDEAKKDSDKLIIELNDKFHKSSEIKKNLAENKISQMKEAAIKEIKDASIKIAVDSVKKIITTSVDKSKLDAVFQKNLDETKEELKKINS